MTYFLDDGSTSVRSMKFAIAPFSHNIDFNTPGVYVVESQLKNKSKTSCAFAIQVVDKDYIDNIINYQKP